MLINVSFYYVLYELQLLLYYIFIYYINNFIIPEHLFQLSLYYYITNNLK